MSKRRLTCQDVTIACPEVGTETHVSGSYDCLPWMWHRVPHDRVSMGSPQTWHLTWLWCNTNFTPKLASTYVSQEPGVVIAWHEVSTEPHMTGSLLGPSNMASTSDSSTWDMPPLSSKSNSCMQMTTIVQQVWCFPAHDELGTCRTSLHANQQSQLHDQSDTMWVAICYVRHNIHDKDAWHQTDLHRMCYQPHASMINQSINCDEAVVMSLAM